MSTYLGLQRPAEVSKISDIRNKRWRGSHIARCAYYVRLERNRVRHIAGRDMPAKEALVCIGAILRTLKAANQKSACREVRRQATSLPGPADPKAFTEKLPPHYRPNSPFNRHRHNQYGQQLPRRSENVKRPQREQGPTKRGNKVTSLGKNPKFVAVIFFLGILVGVLFTVLNAPGILIQAGIIGTWIAGAGALVVKHLNK